MMSLLIVITDRAHYVVQLDFFVKILDWTDSKEKVFIH